MSTQNENTELQYTEGSWLQWIKSDKIGSIVQIKNIDDVFINFTDGSRCTLSLASEYLASSSPGVNLGLNNTNNVPLPVEEFRLDKNITLTPKQIKEESKEIADPLVSMLKTLSKKNSANFPLELLVNIPSEAMFSVMTCEVEEQDLKDAISKMILSQISIDRVQEEIKLNVNTFINKYYAK
jgi:hypothetical protein